MILLSNFVWEGTSLEEKPATEDGAMDGHFLKEIDTGNQYMRRYGIWCDLSTGLAFIKAAKAGLAVSDEDGMADIVFNTPFATSDYVISFGTHDPAAPQTLKVPYYYDITINGFKVITRQATGGIAIGNITFS